MGELQRYNAHMEKFNNMLKRNEEDLIRKLRTYDIALSKNMKTPIQLTASPERRKFVAEYLVPDLRSQNNPTDKASAMEEIRRHYSRSMDNSPLPNRQGAIPEMLNRPYEAQGQNGQNYLFDKYLNQKRGQPTTEIENYHRYKKASNPSLGKNLILLFTRLMLMIFIGQRVVSQRVVPKYNSKSVDSSLK